jgi:hypothetical protein
MVTITEIINSVKSSGVVAIMTVLGVIAFVSAGIIAWPALTYLGAKLVS